MTGTKGLLDQLLSVGASMVKSPTGNSQDSAGGLDPLLKGLLTGVGGGMLGSMLGSKGGTNSIGKVGGTAALAALAYKAYQNYAANSGKSGDLLGAVKDLFGGEAPDAESFANSPDADLRSKAMLLAVINAAKADGVFDDEERKGISAEVEKFSSDAAIVAWVKEQLDAPLDIQGLASMATNPQIATEIYLTSVAACRDLNEQEKTYLESLRKALGIDEGLKSSIEQQLFS